MEKNEGVKEAVVTVRKMSEDEKMKRLAFLREKAILDEKAMYNTGVSDGQRKKVIEIAKAMIEEKIDIKVISKTTKLTIEEIKKLMK